MLLVETSLLCRQPRILRLVYANSRTSILLLAYKVKLMEERNMKLLDSNLATLSARCNKDLELNLAKSFLSEMGQCTTAYPYNQLLGALVLKNYERQDATLLSWNFMYRASPSKPAPISTPKKFTKASPSKPDSIPIQQEVVQPVHKETSQTTKVVMPSKYGVLKQLKKMAHRPRHSPERHVIEVVSDLSPSLLGHDLWFILYFLLAFRVLSLGPKTPCFSSPQRESQAQSIFEATSSLGRNVETFHVDTTINLGDRLQFSIPEQTSVIPPEVSSTNSNMEEVRTSGITANISDMGVNVIKGDGVSTSFAVSATFEAFNIDTTTSLQPYVSPTLLPISTSPPTFQNILNQPITYLFPL
ncbi:unnamed protein product [Lactuca saligna]|uniref:Uncharacterized protein n=1 Tax=Lactuca saligna TaxID=75948 RepID=A0AA35ZYY4_LACSI|nr:unnamed protein product [Lactuca saligna]